MDELPFAVGDVVADKFRVERIIGRGGMGIVLAARHLELDETVALKFLHPDLLGSPERVSRFVQEARAAARLKGINVARVHDVGTLDSTMPYIVMEHLDGEDLRELVVRDGPLPVADAVAHVLGACVAMAEAHARGIIHRDLKPKNLFLTRGVDGKPLVKVLDFGICKLPPGTNPDLDETRADATMGSPNYISPEQMKSARNVDVRTDVWALGAVLYFLLTRRPPFQADNLPELCLKVLHDPPDPLEADVPPGLAAIVLRCMEKDPADRPQSVGELAHALVPFAGERGAELVARGERVLAESASAALRGARDAGAKVPAATRAPAAGETLATGVPGSAPVAARGFPWTWAAIGGAVVAAAIAGVVVLGARGGGSAPPLDAGADAAIDAAVVDAGRADTMLSAAAGSFDAAATRAPIDAAAAGASARDDEISRRADARRRRPPPDARPPAPPDARPPAPPDAAPRPVVTRPDAAPARPRLDPRDRRD